MKKAMIALAAAALLRVAPAAAVTPDDFRIETVDDLVDVCSTPETDPYYTAAINFCHGYTVGAWQFYEALMARPGHKPFVCLPNPSPSRSQTITEFLAWVKAKPEYKSSEAVDTMFKFLTGRFPCAEAPAAKDAGAKK